jgi:5-formyltetrahydrofolate cyclo-ligase
MSADEDRRVLRAELRRRRAALDPATRIAAAQALPARLEEIPEYLTDGLVAGYWAVDGELPLMGVLPGLRARGQTYCLPLLGPHGALRFAPWKIGEAVAPNRYGIPEPFCDDAHRLAPEALDVVLVPLLGFDRRGHRLGFGGGWYDRSFAFLAGRLAMAHPLLVGVGYAAQEVDAIEAMPWDVQLDYIATERELIECLPPPA